MNFWQFAAENPWQAFFMGPFLLIVLYIVLFIVAGTIFRMWNRLMRCLSIRKHGWPPAHCDADGDQVKP